MARNFQSSTVTYVFIDPKDSDQKEVKHSIKDLIETPDEATLLALGDALQKLIPYQNLVDVQIDREEELVADSTPAAQQTGTPAGDQSGTEATGN
ncbi:hypothetical protein [Lacticaseibacillus hulanensis]|uniref:hypothetical protein n=1 Tax=Lacticaseibacillus hulanensis TaxID=2493111 RepID=UPI000FD9EDF6|nr:hypothetical protein [Lacticaseibacillus hulanensis]